MENSIIDLISSYKLIATLLFGALTALFIIVKNWISFSEYFKYKKINHFSKLLDTVKNDTELQKSIEIAKHQAVFQSLFGHAANNKMIDATCKVFNRGDLSFGKIKLCYKFFRLTDQETLKIEFSKGDKWLAAFSGIMVFLGAFYFLLLALLTLLAKKINTLQTLGLVVTILIMFLLYAFTIGSEVRDYLIAKRIKKELNL